MVLNVGRIKSLIRFELTNFNFTYWKKIFRAVPIS
jgi:hypothetical protein